MWPILLFSFLAIVRILQPETQAQRVSGFKIAACAVIAILLAKERFVLIAAGAGFVALRLAIALAITRDWRTFLVGLLVSAGIVCAILLARGDWKPSYEWPTKTNILALLVGVAGLVAGVAVVVWLNP